MSSLGLDSNEPLPPVDDDSELVGKNDKLGKPDPGDDTTEHNDTDRIFVMPVAGGTAFPIPVASEDEDHDEADE
jgi:hypothetical protein